MLNVSDATKQAYKDFGESRQIEIKIYTDTPIILTNSEIAINSLSVEEILEPTDNLTFTGCNASILKFKSVNTIDDILGKKVEVKITTGNTDTIPLFTGYIDSATNTSFEKVSMDIVAYDILYQINNTDYKSWYDSLFVNHDYVTLKQLRDNFFTRVNIEQKTINLPNDSMHIYKSVEDQNLMGGDILRWICQLNGKYGRIGRTGKFEYVNLEGKYIHPSATLFPGPNIYPGMNMYVEDINSAEYKLDTIKFEKYTVKGIDGVQLIDKDNHVIASAGKETKTNIFNVSGNPFIYGIPQAELDYVAQNLYDAINACRYVPVSLEMVGLPYIECGDYFSVVTRDTVFNTIILHRVLNGEQALIDAIESNGNEYQPIFSPNMDEKIQEAVQKSRAIADEEITNYDVAVRRMNDLAARSLGTYTDYEDPVTGGRIYYMSNMPITKVDGICHFDDLAIAYKIDGVGFYVSRPVESPGSDRVWIDGYDAQTGELVINVLDAVGIHADWVKTGLLADESYDPNNPYASNFWNLHDGSFSLRASTKVGGSTVQQIADTSSAAAQARAEATAAQNLATAVASIDSDISDLQDQIDGNVTTWYYSGVPTLNNPPANQWTTTTDKDNHIGDIYYDSDTGYAYRFMKDGNNYVWVKISDSDIEAALAEAQDAWDLADNKRRIFVSQPVPPYDVGDLWVQGSNGDIKRCATAKTDTQTYNASDWVLASKYTDDSALTSWISGTYTTDKTNLQSQIDSKAETWYQSADPSSAWTTEALKNQHIGDLWYKTTDDTTWYYTKEGSTYKWVQQNVPTEVFDKIDGKAQIYTSQPTTPYHVGDLWFASTSSEIKVCITERLSGNYTASDWAKRDKYTDDSAFTSFRDGTYASFVTATNTGIENAQNTANSKIVTYYQASAPSTHSTGDLWIDTDDGNKLYRWNGSSWANVQDSGIQSALTAASNAQTTADGKIVTFAQTSAPTATDVGDLWIDTDDNNKMYRWNGSSWVALSDSSSLVAWVSATYTTDKTNLQNQIDGKAETWYQANDPSTNWSASEKTKHTGDLWYKTSDDTTWYYTGTQWVQQNVPTAVFDKIDGKAQIFTSQPTPPYNVGDLWCVGTTGDILTCVTARATGNYTATDWEKRNKYTDDTAVNNLNTALTQQEIFNRLTNNGETQGIYLSNNKLYINASYIAAGVIADAAGKFSLNMTTGALTMNSGLFKGEINVNNNFLVNSSGDMTAKSGSFGALKIDSSNSSVYAEGVITLMDDNITLDTSGADRRYNYDLIIDTAYFSTGTYIGYKYSTFSGVNSDELGTVSLYRYYEDGSISSRIEYITVYALSTFQYQFNEYMYSNNGMYLLRFNLKYNGVYRTLKFTIKTLSTMKSLLFSGADGIVAPSIKGTLRGKVQASDFTCGGWRFEGRNKKTFFYGEVSSSEDYVRLDVFDGLTINYSLQNYRMHVGLTGITRYDNGVTWYAQFYQGSDERIKENIKPIDTELSVNLINKTEPKSFSFIHDTGTHYGMIAQEARAVLDELGEEDARLEHELNISEMPVENMRTIEYVEYIPHLINYVKELKSEINELKAELNKLKEEK